MTSTAELPKLSKLYPLRFEPIFQYRVWGGTKSSALFPTTTPANTIGEAWLLSDRVGHASVVAEGPLRGWTIHDLLERAPEELVGAQAGTFDRFPLLIKFLSAHTMLSIQVHPADHHQEYLPVGESGKSEAWVVLEAEKQSRIFLGPKPGTTVEALERAAGTESVIDNLVSFTPRLGDCVFIPAGTIHSLGMDVVVLEVQQNSDVTFRLYDWERTDPMTGQPRDLQISQALACTDFCAETRGPIDPVLELSRPFSRERLVDSKHFGMWRISGDSPFPVGEVGKARVLVVIEGEGEIIKLDAGCRLKKGNVLLLPAAVGACILNPKGLTTVLEISLPLSGRIPC